MLDTWLFWLLFSGDTWITDTRGPVWWWSRWLKWLLCWCWNVFMWILWRWDWVVWNFRRQGSVCVPSKGFSLPPPHLYLCSPRPQIWPTSHSNTSLSKGSLLPSSIGELQLPCLPFTLSCSSLYTVADPDLQIREVAGGGRLSRPGLR